MSGRLGISYENPPVINGSAQLYKYEPFSYEYYTTVAGDTLQLTSTPEIVPYVTATSNALTYGSSNGYGISYPGSFPFSLSVLDSNSNVVDSRSFNVFVGNGRFFPPASNSVFTLYRNEPVISTFGTPIELDTCANMTTVFSVPSLPVGLVLAQADICGYRFQIGGTPTVQIPASNYQFIGKNDVNGRVVTTTINIGVSGERVRLDLSGSSNVVGMTTGTPIAERAVTARYPVFYSPSQFRYEWDNSLPDGLFFANASGTPVATYPAYYQPTDVSSTLLIKGSPTLAAANTLATSGASNYTVNVKGRVLGGPSNVIPFTFAFGETVLFTSNSVPTLPTIRNLYVGETLTGTNNIRFFAKTYFSSNVGISNIYSPDLRADLSLAYSGSQAYMFTPTQVLYPSSDTFTLRAVNSNGTTRDVPLSVTTLLDSVSFDYGITPAIGTNYNFIISRPLANAKLGYYTSPIRFRANAASPTANVVYNVTGIAGTGIFTDLSFNNLLLTGTPNAVTGLTPLSVTATNTLTGATASTSVTYSILADIFSFTAIPAFPTTFLQNQPIAPVQVKATTLSERNVVSYGATGLPDGLTLSPFGKLQGTPNFAGSGAYTITATTGFQTGSISVPYTVEPDAIFFIPPTNRIYIGAGCNVPPIQYDGITYSGLNVSNYVLDLSYYSPGFVNPTSFGVTLNSNGVFGGTMTTSIPPQPVLQPSTNPVPFYVTAESRNISGLTDFVIAADNPYALRSYMITQNKPGYNSIYYTDLVLSNTDVPDDIVQRDYFSWYPLSIPGINSNTWFSDIAIRTFLDSNNFTSNITVVAVANDISTGYVIRSTDGISFTTNQLPAGTIMTSVGYSPLLDIWVAAGIQNYDGDYVYAFRSLDNGLTWESAQIIDSGGNTLGTRIGTDSAYETYGTSMVIDYYGDVEVGGSSRPVPNSKARIEIYWPRDYSTPNPYSYNIRTTETSLVLPFYSPIQPGSDLYRTGDSNLSFIGSTDTMIEPSIMPIIFGQFNTFCYDAWPKNFNDSTPPPVWLAIGVHYYAGQGFRTEVRYAYNNPITNTAPLWNLLDAVNIFLSLPFTPDRPKPPLAFGPIWSDDMFVNIFINSQSPYDPEEFFTAVARHPLSDPDITQNWTFLTTNVFLGPSPNAPRLIDIQAVKITSPVRISTGPIRPFIDFTTLKLGNPPVFTSPTQIEYNWYQYVPIESIQITAIPGDEFSGPTYLFVRDADLPDGMSFNPLTGLLSGTPFECFSRREIQVYAFDINSQLYTNLVLTVSSHVPRIVKQQTGAGAYTSLVRQYTEASGAQNARDSRVYPNQERALGEFMLPDAPDVTTQTVDPSCFNPNVCGPAPIVPAPSPLPPPPPPPPSVFINIGLWLDAAGDQNFQLAGSNILTWFDKSPYARNATGVNSPEYMSSSVKLRGAYFNANLDFLTSNSHSAFAVLSMPVDTYSPAHIYGAAAYGFDQTKLLGVGFGRFGSNDYYDMRLGFVNVFTPDVTSNFKKYKRNLVNWEWIDNTSKSVYANGNFEATTNQGGTITGIQGGGVIGRSWYHGTEYAIINEIIWVMNEDITPSNRQLIEGYLAWKWGTQAYLPPSHPYYNGAPNVNILPKPP